MAIVSKSIFDKDAHGLTVGECWGTTAYVSSHAALESLASGGALFLVTVRPDSTLWLVAVLESPKRSKGAWRATNSTPIRDITASIASITFANGKGLVRDAKLAMSLQTPRELSSDTAKALREIASGASAATKSAKTHGGGAAARAAVKETKSSVEAAPTGAPRAKAGRTRPAVVPDGAYWNAADQSWEHGETDAQRMRQGPWRFWRDDGTLRGTCAYRDHDLDGVLDRFHPDGALASRGHWREGILERVVFYRAKNETDEQRLRQGGDAVESTEFVGDRDGLANVTIRFYDAEGRERDSVGALVPPRPEGVPATARYFSNTNMDGSIGIWCDGATPRENEGKSGPWRWWSAAGQLLRTELHGVRGGLFAVVTPHEDPIADELDQYFADPQEQRFSFARQCSLDLHARVRDRLKTSSALMVREYISVLDAELDEWHGLWPRDRSRYRSILEVVDDWNARGGADATDVDAMFIAALGAKAALHLRDTERMKRYWTKFASIKRPKKLPDSYAFNSLDDAFDKGGAVRSAIEAILSGTAEKKHEKLREGLSTSKSFAAVSDEDLADFVAAKARSTPCSVILRDRASCEAWLLDQEQNTHYWNGRELAPSTVRFDPRPYASFRYLAQHDECDERTLYWPGKHGWLVLQRYGRAVLWQGATYYSSRGQAEVTRQMWFKTATPAEAQRLMKLIAGNAKPVGPWEDDKLGTLFRTYNNGNLVSLGVKGKTLVSRAGVLERFATHQDAAAAFDAIEIERLRSGYMIARLQASAIKS